MGISLVRLGMAQGSLRALLRRGGCNTGGTCAWWEGDCGLLGEAFGDGGRRGGRQRGPGLGDRRVGGRLRTRLWLLAVPVNVVLAPVQVEGTKLDGSTLQLLVGCLRHAHSLLLVQEPPLGLAGSARDGSALCGSAGGRGKSTRGCLRGLVLGVRGGDRRCVRADGRGSRIPRVGGLTGCSLCHRWVGFVDNLLKVRLSQLVLGGRQSNFWHDYHGVLCGSLLLRRLGRKLSDLFGGGLGSRCRRLVGGRERFDSGLGLGVWNGGRSLFGGLRCGLGGGGLSEHAGPGLCGPLRDDSRLSRLRSGGGSGSRRSRS